MKGLLLKAALLVTLCAAYVGAPFVTAWSIREAVRNGDSAYLARAIAWDSVRATLKPTLSQIALDLPEAAGNATVQPTLWQRVKTYFGQSAVDTAIDNYLTPEGLPQLFQMRKTYRTYVSGFDEDANRPPLLQRIERAWARVKRAEFISPTEVQIDMLDKHDDTRLYLGKLELGLTGWKLTELRIKTLSLAERAPAKPSAAAPSGSKLKALNFVSPAEAAPLKKHASPFITYEARFDDGLKRSIKVPAGKADAFLSEMEASGLASQIREVD